jgi:hypothetical protein
MRKGYPLVAQTHNYNVQPWGQFIVVCLKREMLVKTGLSSL